ncbi:MAG: HlyD family secretion protein [Candidatus Cyclobacteriaceae bacterium M2_1C_046]
MLNISKHKVRSYINHEKYKSLSNVENRKSTKWLIRLLTGFFILILLIFFLPWTQNIRSEGNVTTLKPDQRPQTIHSVLPGRIEEWFVLEGDYVQKGDTIIFISEVKDEYFDPNLLTRTKEQIQAKEMAVRSYEEKVKALNNQIEALAETRVLKLEQAENKVKQAHLRIASDSMDYRAAVTNYEIAQQQLERTEQLYQEGLKSLTDLETRRLNVQKTKADMISAENKLLTSRNELINAMVELSSIEAQFRDEISKAQSEKFTALSNKFDAEAAMTKLQNQYSNYVVRTGMYYITAPQNGYITETLQAGIGELVKEGEPLISIMPANFQLAVEMYVKPLDLPLLKKGQDVRIQFEGWPAIVFSGWPNVSYGTYGGEIFAIDNFISKNGKFRVLVAPDPQTEPWPDALRPGSGTSSMVLLKDVPIWYELWRQINGFPPDYYTEEMITQVETK